MIFNIGDEVLFINGTKGVVISNTSSAVCDHPIEVMDEYQQVHFLTRSGKANAPGSASPFDVRYVEHTSNRDDSAFSGHYKSVPKEMEPINVAYVWKSNSYVTHALKYLYRAGRKENESEIKDISKAIDCLQQYLTKLGG